MSYLNQEIEKAIVWNIMLIQQDLDKCGYKACKATRV